MLPVKPEMPVITIFETELIWKVVAKKVSHTYL